MCRSPFVLLRWYLLLPAGDFFRHVWTKKKHASAAVKVLPRGWRDKQPCLFYPPRSHGLDQGTHGVLSKYTSLHAMLRRVRQLPFVVLPSPSEPMVKHLEQGRVGWTCWCGETCGGR